MDGVELEILWSNLIGIVIERESAAAHRFQSGGARGRRFGVRVVRQAHAWWRRPIPVRLATFPLAIAGRPFASSPTISPGDVVTTTILVVGRALLRHHGADADLRR
jgi:hypothetical protein